MEITADSKDASLPAKIARAADGTISRSEGAEVAMTSVAYGGNGGTINGIQTATISEKMHGIDINEEAGGLQGIEVPLAVKSSDTFEEASSSDGKDLPIGPAFARAVDISSGSSGRIEDLGKIKDSIVLQEAINGSNGTKVGMTAQVDQAFEGVITGGEYAEVPFMTKIAGSFGGTANVGVESTEYVVPAIIDGKDIITSSTFDVVAPGPNKFLHKCSSVSIEEAILAVEAAEKAFPAWRDTLPGKRRDIFLKAAEIVERRATELGRYMEEETGSASFWAEGFNVPVSVDSLKDIAGRIGALAGSIPTMADANRTALIFKEPFGVVMGIAPWNAPYILGFRSIAYAIAAGNTAILKASELSPRCSWAIGDCFREAGLPDGVLNVIAHRPSDAAAVTKALIEHPSLKKLNFTGSTMVGKIIGRLAGENLKPVLLELGGKAPAIVWEDADLKLAAHECALGAFLHTGQVCMATERIIVHKNVTSRFEEELKAATKEMFSEAGIMVNKMGVDKNNQLVNDALGKGATLVYGNVDPQESDNRMAAVILKGVTPQMDIYLTESFGPSVSMYVIDTEEEALRLANDTDYGLHAAIFTEDLRRALRMAKDIEAGAIHINAMTVHDEPALPHGGVKGSGYGRFGSFGLEEWVKTKTVTFKK